MGLLVHPLDRALAREGDERRVVEVGIRDRGDEVQRSGPERAEADAGAPGQAADHVRHVGAALLLANGHERDRRMLQRVVEVERLLAGDAEHVAHAFGLEALDEDVGGAAGGHPWAIVCEGT